MRKRLVYFSLSAAVALAALVTQFSSPLAVAQPPPPRDASEECSACAQSCDLFFQACTAERGARGPGFGQCMRETQECRRTCNARGGPCDRRASNDAPAPTPTPTPDPD